MKLVIGIVRPEKANDLLEALSRAEVRGVSLRRVQGHGGELDRVETYPSGWTSSSTARRPTRAARARSWWRRSPFPPAREAAARQ